MQESLLDNIDFMKYTTTLQYFILILQVMKHPKIIRIMFNFIFGFMEDEILDSDQQSSGQFDNINQGHDLPLVIDGQHIEMIQPMEVGGNQENDIFFEKPIEDSNNNIESNSSSFNRGPFMPVENIQDYSGNQEMLTKPAPTQNLIVDSSTDSEGEGNDMMNIEENYEDPFGDDDDSNSKRTFDPTN